MYPNYKMWDASQSGYTDKKSKTQEAWTKKPLEVKKQVQASMGGTKYKSIKVYMRDILKSSLITSIPEITLSKSWTKKIIKILVFLLCLVGFIYQALDFLWLYLSYPTVVNVLISNPFKIEQPAITICNRNRQRRSAICSYPGNKCSHMPPDTYCKTYPRNCPTGRTPNTAVPFLNDLLSNKWYWDEQLEDTHNESMIQRCYKVNEGKRVKCEKDFMKVPVVTSVGEPNICYAIESLWQKPDIEPDIYPNTFTIELEINTQPEDYMIYTEPVLIQIAVHDRRKLVNPYAVGYSLKGGVEYEATVTMTEKKLLPSPYNTNCTDYLAIWKKNNGTGPLNDLMCIEYCKLDTLLRQGKCIDKNVAYPHMEDLCERNKVTTTGSIIENCTKSCGNPCSDNHYEVRYEEINNYDHVCKDLWCRNSKVKLTLFFKQFRVTKFQYQPKFESVEMFSYIGGYMGMWLGLSLVSLFDFLETVAYLLYFPIGHMRWKAKKKSAKSALKAFHHDPYFRSPMY